MPRPNTITRTTDVLTFLKFIDQQPDLDRPECKQAYSAMRRDLESVSRSHATIVRIGLSVEVLADPARERDADIRAFVDAMRNQHVTEKLCVTLVSLLAGHSVERQVGKRGTRYSFKEGAVERFRLSEGKPISLEKLYEIAAIRFPISKSRAKAICLYR